MSDVRTLIFCNTGPTSIAIRLFNSQKNNAILLHLPRQSYSLYEKGLSIFCLPVLPLSHLHTSEPYCTLHKLKQRMHSHTGKTQPILQYAHPTQVTHSPCRAHTYTHTQTYGCVTSCRDGATSISLAFSGCGFAKQECKALPSQPDIPPLQRSHKYPLWVLYGPILFSPTQSQRCHGHVLLSL